MLELLNNNNLKLVPLDNGPPISTHINNCKPGLQRTHLEANDTAAPLSPQEPTLDPFLLSQQVEPNSAYLEDEDDTSCSQPKQTRPAGCATHTNPVGACSSLTYLSYTSSFPDRRWSWSNLPRVASTSSLTLATAKSEDVLEYVYDQLPLEWRLAKMFKKKQPPSKKWKNIHTFFLGTIFPFIFNASGSLFSSSLLNINSPFCSPVCRQVSFLHTNLTSF